MRWEIVHGESLLSRHYFGALLMHVEVRSHWETAALHLLSKYFSNWTVAFAASWTIFDCHALSLLTLWATCKLKLRIDMAEHCWVRRLLNWTAVLSGERYALHDAILLNLLLFEATSQLFVSCGRLIRLLGCFHGTRNSHFRQWSRFKCLADGTVMSPKEVTLLTWI